jgi:hypothetical protein
MKVHVTITIIQIQYTVQTMNHYVVRITIQLAIPLTLYLRMETEPD